MSDVKVSEHDSIVTTQGRIVRVRAADLKPRTWEDAQRLARESDASDEELTRRALSDPDNLPVSEEDIARGRVRIVRRPRSPGAEQVEVKLDEHVVAWFRARGGETFEHLMHHALVKYMDWAERLDECEGRAEVATQDETSQAAA